jgi:hypothetical protein
MKDATFAQIRCLRKAGVHRHIGDASHGRS